MNVQNVKLLSNFFSMWPPWPISWTRRIQNISKNQNLYPHQSRITYQPMLWDILDWLNNQHFTTFRKSTKCCAQTISLESSIVKLFNSESNVDYIIFSSRWKDCQVSHLIREKLRWTYGALRVSRTGSRPGDPEAGPRRFGGRGRSGLTL